MEPPRFTRPLIHTLCTPDLSVVLSNSRFDSLSHLVSAFSSSPSRSPALNNVQIRTPPNHEPRLVRHFPIEFRDRPLPLSSSPASPLASTSQPMTREPSLGGSQISPGQKDELFLDQLSNRIIQTTTRRSASSSSLPPQIHLDPTRLYRKKQLYDLDGNLLPPPSRREARLGTEEEWQDQTLDDLTPWYREFKSKVFERREMVESETWGWPVGCILAISTNHPDPLNALSLLWDLTSPSQLYSPSSSSSSSTNPFQHEYVNPEILRYILIVHDARTDDDGSSTSAAASWEQVKRLEETVKKTYGVHTKVLPLYDHSRDMELPLQGGGGEREREELRRQELEKLWPVVREEEAEAEEEEEGKKGFTSQGGNEDGNLVGLGYAPPHHYPEEAGGGGGILRVTKEERDRERPGHDLSLKDLQTLSSWIRELVTQSVIPSLERTVTVSNEQFNSSKKSLGGRLFSVGRKYFGGGGGGGGGSTPSNTTTTSSTTTPRSNSPVNQQQLGYNAQRGYYPFQAPESQTRRLGDLAFMLRDYKLASTIYGEVAKDFKTDKAWKLYSNCLRVQGLSLLLHALSTTSTSSSSSSSTSTNMTTLPDSLLVNSILQPSLTEGGGGGGGGGGFDFDLLRSTMLYHEYYQHLSPVPTRTSSNSLMRLVDLSIERAKQRRGGGGGGDEDELWTAMVCEQSALSQLGITNNNKSGSTATTMIGDGSGNKKQHRRERKFVLEMCLAGIRYEKSGLKSLSRRCLSQACSLYSLPPSSSSSPALSSGSSSLSRATTATIETFTQFEAVKTNLHHSLARQAYHAGQPLDSISHYLQLLPTTTSLVVADQDERETIGGGGGGGGGGISNGSNGLDWLDDFALAWDLLGKTGEPPGEGRASRGQERAEKLAREARVELPVKLFRARDVKLSRRFGGGGGGTTGSECEERNGNRVWQEMERRMMARVRGGGETLKGKLKEDQALIGETFYLELPIKNPLEAFLSIGDLTVQLRDGTERKLEIDQSLDGQVIELAPLESRIIYVPMRGDTVGRYEFDSISYRFHNLLPVVESLSTAIKSSPRSVAVPLQAQQQSSASVPGFRPPSVELRRPIPVLSVETDRVPERLLHGQTRTVKLKLANTAQRVGLQRLRGISSDPEYCSFSVASSSSTEEEEDPRVLNGDEGKIRIENTIKQNAPVELLRDGEVLGPGQEIEVEVHLRGDQVGEKEINWLFAYESPDGGSNEIFSMAASRRFEVSPSLEFRYATRPTPIGQHPFVLNVEAYNSGIPTEDLRITSISLLSPLWRLSLLPNQTLEQVFSKAIPWQQISNLSLGIERVEAGLGQCEKSIAWSVGQIRRLLEGKKIENGAESGEVELSFSSVSPESRSIPESKPFRPLLNAHAHQRELSLVADFPTVPAPLLASLFPLFSPTSAVVVISYDSPTLAVSGEHYLALPSLGAPQSHLDQVLTEAELKAGGLYEESQRERTTLIKCLRTSELGREQDPANVSVSIDETKLSDHDFERDGPCSFRIDFLIRNLSPIASLEFTLTLGTSTPSALVYTGLLTRRGTIPSLGSTTVSTNGFITREGVYDVGGWTLQVETTTTTTTKKKGKSWKRQGEKREVRARGKSEFSRSETRPLVDVTA